MEQAGNQENFPSATTGPFALGGVVSRYVAIGGAGAAAAQAVQKRHQPGSIVNQLQVWSHGHKANFTAAFPSLPWAAWACAGLRLQARCA